MVGTAGFEPTTPCTQNKCATKLRHAPTLASVYKKLWIKASPFLYFFTVFFSCVFSSAKKLIRKIKHMVKKLIFCELSPRSREKFLIFFPMLLIFPVIFFRTWRKRGKNDLDYLSKNILMVQVDTENTTSSSKKTLHTKIKTKRH